MKILFVLLLVLGGLYMLVCGLLYLKQESLLFFPQKLPATYRFSFPGRFEERWIQAADGTRLHGLLFRADAPKGLLFYLHGNAGSLAAWGELAPVYTRLGYDVFMLDYRGYGKSEGRITSQDQLLRDVETAYEQVQAPYAASQVVILGYSLGTEPAAWLAARHQPKFLLLQAPYYSLQDMAQHLFPWVPGVVMRYPMPTHTVLPQVKAPIFLFHGDQDEVVYYGSSQKLQPLLKPTDQLITLPGAGHNGMTDNPLYLRSIRTILGNL